MKLLSFRAKNFRGFIDTGHVVLKPINILVGKNSIGKSSFARLWPIFNQGSKLQKRAPIIWNGDLVDFGSFKNVLSRHSNGKTIGFEFNIEIDENDSLKRMNTINYARKVRHLATGELVLKLQLVAGVDQSSTNCSEFSISAHGKTVKYTFDGTGLLVEVSCEGASFKFLQYTQERNVGFLIPMTDFFLRKDESLVPAWSSMRAQLYYFLRENLHQKLANERIHDICGRLNVCGSDDDLLQYCKSLPYQYKTWLDFLIELSKNLTLLKLFNRFIFSTVSEILIRDIDSDLRHYFSQVNYIRPLRATAQRYYRRQDLAVNNIDSEGANLAFFLASLTVTKLARLNEWLEETIDVKVKLDGEQGHVMVTLEDINTGRTDNMADMGFGFSQVLPLAVQAWISSSPHARTAGRISIGNTILVWEQPELHLHPAMQRKLARLIAKTITIDPKQNISFIIETHSQSIINELGDLIVENEDFSSSIQILLFEQIDMKETIISTTNFNEDGQLSNWPFGFLSV